MANRRGAFIVLPMSDPPLSAHRRIMLAGEGARPTCGSPALRNGEYCYFHRRWRSTHVDLSQSAHHVSSMFDLPVPRTPTPSKSRSGKSCASLSAAVTILRCLRRSHPEAPALSPAGRGIWRGSAQGLMFMRHRRRELAVLTLS